MNKNKVKQNLRKRRHKRVRAKIFGTAENPRLCVSRSLKGVYLQLIDDENGKTLMSQNDKGLNGTKMENARKAGVLLAEKAVKSGIKSVVFDRGSFIYHGRIKEVAEGARQAGLEF